MLELNMIEPTDELNDSVNGIVIAKKQNGKLRLSLELQVIKQSNKSSSTFPPCEKQRTFLN